MRKLLVILSTMVLLASCTNREEVIEQTFPDGTKKVVMAYVGEGDDRKPIEQTSYYITGQVEVNGKFDGNKKRTGSWVYYYEDGKKWSECDYKDGLRHGKSVTYFENGNKRYEGTFAEEKQTGKWVFYNEDGSVKSEKKY